MEARLGTDVARAGAALAEAEGALARMREEGAAAPRQAAPVAEDEAAMHKQQVGVGGGGSRRGSHHAYGLKFQVIPGHSRSFQVIPCKCVGVCRGV